MPQDPKDVINWDAVDRDPLAAELLQDVRRQRQLEYQTHLLTTSPREMADDPEGVRSLTDQMRSAAGPGIDLEREEAEFQAQEEAVGRAVQVPRLVDQIARQARHSREPGKGMSREGIEMLSSAIEGASLGVPYLFGYEPGDLRDAMLRTTGIREPRPKDFERLVPRIQEAAKLGLVDAEQMMEVLQAAEQHLQPDAMERFASGVGGLVPLIFGVQGVGQALQGIPRLGPMITKAIQAGGSAGVASRVGFEGLKFAGYEGLRTFSPEAAFGGFASGLGFGAAGETIGAVLKQPVIADWVAKRSPLSRWFGRTAKINAEMAAGGLAHSVAVGEHIPHALRPHLDDPAQWAISALLAFRGQAARMGKEAERELLREVEKAAKEAAADANKVEAFNTSAEYAEFRRNLGKAIEEAGAEKKPASAGAQVADTGLPVKAPNPTTTPAAEQPKPKKRTPAVVRDEVMARLMQRKEESVSSGQVIAALEAEGFSRTQANNTLQKLIDRGIIEAPEAGKTAKTPEGAEAQVEPEFRFIVKRTKGGQVTYGVSDIIIRRGTGDAAQRYWSKMPPPLTVESGTAKAPPPVQVEPKPKRKRKIKLPQDAPMSDPALALAKRPGRMDARLPKRGPLSDPALAGKRPGRMDTTKPAPKPKPEAKVAKAVAAPPVPKPAPKPKVKVKVPKPPLVTPETMPKGVRRSPHEIAERNREQGSSPLRRWERWAKDKSADAVYASGLHHYGVPAEKKQWDHVRRHYADVSKHGKEPKVTYEEVQKRFDTAKAGYAEAAEKAAAQVESQLSKLGKERLRDYVAAQLAGRDYGAHPVETRNHYISQLSKNMPRKLDAQSKQRLAEEALRAAERSAGLIEHIEADARLRAIHDAKGLKGTKVSEAEMERQQDRAVDQVHEPAKGNAELAGKYDWAEAFDRQRLDQRAAQGPELGQSVAMHRHRSVKDVSEFSDRQKRALTLVRLFESGRELERSFAAYTADNPGEVAKAKQAMEDHRSILTQDLVDLGLAMPAPRSRKRKSGDRKHILTEQGQEMLDSFREYLRANNYPDLPIQLMPYLESSDIQWLGAGINPADVWKAVSTWWKKNWVDRDTALLGLLQGKTKLTGKPRAGFNFLTDNLAEIAPTLVPEWARLKAVVVEANKHFDDIFRHKDAPEWYRTDPRVGLEIKDYDKTEAHKSDMRIVDVLQGLKPMSSLSNAEQHVARGIRKAFQWARKTKVLHENAVLLEAVELAEKFSTGAQRVSPDAKDLRSLVRRIARDPKTGNQVDWDIVNKLVMEPGEAGLLRDMVKAKANLEPGKHQDFTTADGKTVRVFGYGLESYFSHVFVRGPDDPVQPDLDAEAAKLSGQLEFMRSHVGHQNLKPRLADKDGYTTDLRFVIKGYLGRMARKVTVEEAERKLLPVAYGRMKRMGTRAMGANKPNVEAFENDVVRAAGAWDRYHSAPEKNSPAGVVEMRNGSLPQRVLDTIGAKRRQRLTRLTLRVTDGKGIEQNNFTDKDGKHQDWMRLTNRHPQNIKKLRERGLQVLNLEVVGGVGETRRFTLYGTEIASANLYARAGGYAAEPGRTGTINAIRARAKELITDAPDAQSALAKWRRSAENGNILAQAGMAGLQLERLGVKLLSLHRLGGVANPHVEALNYFEALTKHLGVLSFKSYRHSLKVVAPLIANPRARFLFGKYHIKEDLPLKEAWARVAEDIGGSLKKAWDQYLKHYPGEISGLSQWRSEQYTGELTPDGQPKKGLPKLLGKVGKSKAYRKAGEAGETAERALYHSQDYSEGLVRLHVALGTALDFQAMKDAAPNGKIKLRDGTWIQLVDGNADNAGFMYRGNEAEPIPFSLGRAMWHQVEATHYHYHRAMHPSMVRLPLWSWVGHLKTYGTRGFSESLKDMRDVWKSDEMGDRARKRMLSRTIWTSLGLYVFGKGIGQAAGAFFGEDLEQKLRWDMADNLGGRPTDLPVIGEGLKPFWLSRYLTVWLGDMPDADSMPATMLKWQWKGITEDFALGEGEDRMAVWWKNFRKANNLWDPIGEDKVGVPGSIAVTNLASLFGRLGRPMLEYILSEGLEGGGLLDNVVVTRQDTGNREEMSRLQAMLRMVAPGKPGQEGDARDAEVVEKAKADVAKRKRDYYASLAQKAIREEDTEGLKKVMLRAQSQGFDLTGGIQKELKYPEQTKRTKRIRPSMPPLNRARLGAELWGLASKREKQEILHRVFGASSSSRRQTVIRLSQTPQGRAALEKMLELAKSL